MAYDNGDPEPTRLELRQYDDKARAAHRIGCRYCGAKPGQLCINKVLNRPARKFIAHTIRIIDAETVRPLRSVPDDEELPF